MKKVFFVVGTILAIAFIAFFVTSKKQSSFPSFKKGCKSNKGPFFTHHITDLTRVKLVQPPGGIEDWEKGKILKSHTYIVVDGKVPVYAPIDSIATEGVYYTEEEMNQYSIFFDVSCEFFYLFDHIQEPVEKLKNAFQKPPSLDTRTYSIGPVEFKAGELIGYSTGTRFAHHFDFGVYDRTHRHNLEDLKGIEVSERDAWALCPFDFFPEEQKQEYFSLFGTIRTDEPVPQTFCLHHD